jgi:hypothetical protein
MTQVRVDPPTVGAPAAVPGLGILLRALLLGVAFGIVLVKSEVVSWYRIQEMFRFQGFHMYGILGSAVLVGMISTAILRKLRIRTLDGDEVQVPRKVSRGMNTRYWLGGAFFGIGWGLLGACPGPIYALIGSGNTVFLAALASALAGTWAYGAVRHRLPHH